MVRPTRRKKDKSVHNVLSILTETRSAYHLRNPPMLEILCINIYIECIDLARAKSEALVSNTCKQKKLNRVMLDGDGNENSFKINRSN